MRTPSTLRALILLAGLVSAASCLNESVTGVRALSFSMTADPTTVAVGEEVTFRIEGTGTNIVAAIVDFGDGTADTLTYPAAVAVVDQTLHAYDEVGAYTAVGTLVAQNGDDSDEVAVTVN